MNTDRYIELRKCYMQFVYKILKSEDKYGIDMKRAGQKLGFIEDNSLVFENEDETNVLMDYLLFEKNGKSNRLVDRFSKLVNSNIDKNELTVLGGMVLNYFSIFEIIEIAPDSNILILNDLLEKKQFNLKDIGFSNTATKGMILASRLIPIEDIYMSSGLSFVFNADKRTRVLAEIGKRSKSRNRKRTIKIKTKKSESQSLMEIMFKAYKKWGIDIVTIEV